MSDLYGMGSNINLNNNGGMGQNDKKKKIMIIGGVGVVGLIIIMMIIIVIISSIDNQKNNIYIDGAMSKMDSTIWYMESDNVPYVCVEKIAPKLNYEFYNGEYGTGSEDKSHCYVRNADELALLEMDSNVVYKTLISDESSTFDYYKMSYKVKRINDKLFISLPTLQKVFNVKYIYDIANNTLIIDTLPALYAKYNAAVKNDGYYSMSDDFSNKKALITNMIVVVTKERQVGVLSSEDGSTIIGTKYPKLVYSEGMNEFFVEYNGKCGVLSANIHAEPTVKIGFEYDSLKVIDNNLGLYLVRNQQKFGVLDKMGKVLINLEYDRIGIENPKLFPTDNIKNSYILYDNCIPVKQGEKWGMFDVNGKLLFEVNKYGFGSVASTSSGQTSQNVLLIPASEGAEGIVVSIKSVTNKVKYGVVDTQGMFRVAPSFDSIYKTTSGGKTEYYMLFGNTILSVADRMKESSKSTSDSGTSTVEIQ